METWPRATATTFELDKSNASILVTTLELLGT
jgi:hypothetical protein